MHVVRQCNRVRDSAASVANRLWARYRFPSRARGECRAIVRLLALFWLAFSAFNTVGAIVLYIVANTVFAHARDFGVPEGPGAFLVLC
jgi:hypothetical protein